jgi:putative transposase
MEKNYKKINEFTKTERNLPHWQNPGSVYFVTFRTYNKFILDDNSKQIIYENIKHYNKIKYELFAFVIMEDHVHLIFQPNEISEGLYFNLSEIMQSIKGFASKQIIKYIKNNEQNLDLKLEVNKVFQSESFDRIIRNDDEFNEKLNYILNNPVKRGIVKDCYSYKWVWFKGKE